MCGDRENKWHSRGMQIIVLLAGGDESTQREDILLGKGIIPIAGVNPDKRNYQDDSVSMKLCRAFENR